MINLKRLFDSPGKLICLFALIFCACEQVPEHCSDHNPYDPRSEFCFENKAYKKCAGGEYNPGQEFCSEDDKVIKRCGGEDYNPATHVCESGVIKEIERNRFTVLFMTDGGTPQTIDPVIVDSGAIFGADFPTAPLKPDNRFDGWFDGTEQYTAVTPIVKNVILTAKWSECTQWSNWSETKAPTCYEAGEETRICLAFTGSQTQPKAQLSGFSECDDGSFTDSRDDLEYRWVRIGSQIWMAENLNFAGSGNNVGVCYNDVLNCDTYGRLYKWNEVMDIGSSFNSTLWNGGDVKRMGICPSGWHIPSDAEWNVLMNTAGGVFHDQGDWGFWSGTGTKLKSKTGWYTGDDYISGTDEYRFSALPGGLGGDGDFAAAGEYGFWWGVTQGGADVAWVRSMGYNHGDVDEGWDFKTHQFSLRCLRDE